MGVAVVMMMVVAAMVSVTAALTAAAAVSIVSVVCCHAPEAVASPGALLAFLGAVLGASTAPAFGELPCVFFPLAALPERALSDATS
jgi:hypothetical protein